MTLTAEALQALRAALPADALRSDDASRVSYGYDNSRRQVMPDAVVFPSDTGQVAAVVCVCAAHGIPLTARGLGSGTAGAAVPVMGGVVMAFERMNRILNVDPGNRLIIAQPGVLNSEVQQAAAEVGAFWAPDPTSSPYSTIGGNLACNAAGPRAVKYGTPRENILGLEAVTGNGSIIRTGTMTTKGVVGYDLTRLLIGSEGTLGLITEATIRLTPLQPSRVTLRASYRSVEGAAAAVAAIMAGPVTPCALEFMDETAIAIVRDHAGTALPSQAAALLLIECDGTEAGLPEQQAAVAAAAQNPSLLEIRHATDRTEVEGLWACRRALSPAQRKLMPHKINEDVVVPVSRLPELVNGIHKLARDHGVLIVSFGHAGNGNLHVNLLGDPAEEGELDRMHRCLSELFILVRALDGTLSGEHGIGYDKRNFVDLEIGPAELDLMRGLKRVFDPKGILNPGKLFPDE